MAWLLACLVFLVCMSFLLGENRYLKSFLVVSSRNEDAKKANSVAPMKAISTQDNVTLSLSRANTSTNTTTAAASAATSLLNVPFYVYESLIWHNFTYGGQDLAETLSQTPLKQSEDFWVMQAALKHPMRTLDPDQAKVFVVPTLMNFVSDAIAMTKFTNDANFQACCHSCRTDGGMNDDNDNSNHPPLCNDALIDHVEAVLSNSTFFQRSHGTDHIMVLSTWYASKLHLRLQESPVFSNIHQIGFEDRHFVAPNRTTLPSTYVGNPCQLLSRNGGNNSNNNNSINNIISKTTDFVMVGSLYEDAGRVKRKRFESRRNVCKWLFHCGNATVNTCGTGEQCPALAEARYGFHVRGDTWGANRLMDTLLSGTVPIFTDAQQYKILPTWIDWKLLSVQVNVTSESRFVQGLQQILDRTDYDTKLEHVLANRDLLDWRTGIAFDVYMAMFQRQILPDSVFDMARLSKVYNFSALMIE